MGGRVLAVLQGGVGLGSVGGAGLLLGTAVTAALGAATGEPEANVVLPPHGTSTLRSAPALPMRRI